MGDLHPRVPDGFTHYFDYFTADGGSGTVHLVREERDSEVVTACGRTLRKKGRMTRLRGGYVSPLTEDSQFGTRTCGRCPFIEVDD